MSRKLHALLRISWEKRHGSKVPLKEFKSMIELFEIDILISADRTENMKTSWSWETRFLSRPKANSSKVEISPAIPIDQWKVQRVWWSVRQRVWEKERDSERDR